ncbi:MAG: hypothetical protein ACTSR2_14855, partial [Candidatus Hodarchaeales archaeon]
MLYKRPTTCASIQAPIIYYLEKIMFGETPHPPHEIVTPYIRAGADFFICYNKVMEGKKSLSANVKNPTNNSNKFLTILLILASFFAASYSIYKIFQLDQEITETETNIEKNTRKLNSISKIVSSHNENALAAFRNIMTQVVLGNVVYEPAYNNEESKIYTSETLEVFNPREEDKYNINVKSYKYIPGLVYKGGYEGVTWNVNMDNWVDWL